MRARAPKGGCTINGRFYKGGQFLPKPLPQPVRLVAMSDEDAIHMTLALMPTSVEAAQALHRCMSGRATKRDRALLDGRRMAAVQTLRDGASSDREWKHWNNVYAGLVAGI